jgi:hypothetical protein
LKLIHLKTKEIQAIQEKIKSLRKNGSLPKRKKRAHVIKKHFKLRKALLKKKIIIKKVLNEIEKNQSKLIKTIGIYDKKFAVENAHAIKNILNHINKQLTSYMKLPYFKKAYSELMSIFSSKAPKLSKSELENPKQTAKLFISSSWKKVLIEAKTSWDEKASRKKDSSKKDDKN